MEVHPAASPPIPLGYCSSHCLRAHRKRSHLFCLAFRKSSGPGLGRNQVQFINNDEKPTGHSPPGGGGGGGGGGRVSHSPVPLWFAFLQQDLPLGSPLAAGAGPPAGPRHPQGLQALGGLLVGELHLLAFLQTAEPVHH